MDKSRFLWTILFQFVFCFGFNVLEMVDFVPLVFGLRCTPLRLYCYRLKAWAFLSPNMGKIWVKGHVLTSYFRRYMYPCKQTLLVTKLSLGMNHMFELCTRNWTIRCIHVRHNTHAHKACCATRHVHVCVWVCVRGKPRTYMYNKMEQWVLGWRLLSANVLGWKTCTNLMGDAYKSLSPATKGTIEGNNRRPSVYTLHKSGCVCVCTCAGIHYHLLRILRDQIIPLLI